MLCELDHLVVGCRDLAAGEAWARDLLGVAAAPGGRHPTMGTHNRLVRLGERTYLELIALDPDGTAPARPRWFGLDEPAVRAAIAGCPRLLSWVVRSDAIDAACARVPALGRPEPFERGPYRWRFALPPAQLRGPAAWPFEGLLPSVIQWDVDAHPAAALPAAGCALQRLRLVHPQADALGAALAALGLTAAATVAAGARAIAATLATPRGEVQLDGVPA